MTTVDRRAADAAYIEAKERYLATVPPPKAEDFPCRWCGAPVGEPCAMKVRGRTGPHRPRDSRYARAFSDWSVGAIDAGDDAVNALYANPAA